MRNLAFWFGLAAAVPTVFAYVRLARLVMQPGPVKPNVASWLPWLAVDGSIFYASLSAGVRTTMFVFGIFTFGCLAIVLLTLRKGRVEFAPLDKFCLVTSAIAFVAWKMTSSPEVAIYLNIIVAVIATVPTIRQGWLTPEKEDGRVWVYFSAGGLLNLFAVEKWDFLNAGPAVMVFALQVILVFVSTSELWRKREAPVYGGRLN